MEPGDWVEGEPRWWWKYVYPAREQFWAELVARISNAGPSPDPWIQSLTADVLEGVAMIHASGRTTDRKVVSQLRHEGLKKIADAANVAQKTQAA
jgi:hypothetical protein